MFFNSNLCDGHLMNCQLSRAEKSQTVGVVILKAAGSVFCSGHDLKQIHSWYFTLCPLIVWQWMVFNNLRKDEAQRKQQYQKLFSSCTAVMEQIRKMPKPVIAQVRKPIFYVQRSG